MAVMENWTQTTFRYRDDDGSESAATWRQTAGTNDSLNVDTTYRMRFLITGSHTGGTGSFDLVAGLQYNRNAGGWNPVTTTSSVVKAVASADTSWTINDDDSTTEQLAGGATFVAGKMDETGSCSAVSISESQESEFEFVFQIVGADVANNDTIELRVYDSGSALDVYSATPSITVVKGSTKQATNGGGASVSVTASGTVNLAPKVWLNSTATLSGATQMTRTAWNSAGTSITFTDPSGAPTGSLQLGVENRNAGGGESNTGWIAVTVTAAGGGSYVPLMMTGLG